MGDFLFFNYLIAFSALFQDFELFHCDTGIRNSEQKPH